MGFNDSKVFTEPGGTNMSCSCLVFLVCGLGDLVDSQSTPRNTLQEFDSCCQHLAFRHMVVVFCSFGHATPKPRKPNAIERSKDLDCGCGTDAGLSASCHVKYHELQFGAWAIGQEHGVASRNSQGVS